MSKREVVAGLDLGSKSLQCVIADVADDYSIEILGVGSSPSKGIKKGVIVNIEEAALAIETAVSVAEKSAGFEIGGIYVGLGGDSLHSVIRRGEVTIASPDRVISENDVRRVIDAARLLGLAAEREIVQVLPRDYIVDGISGVKKPVGMSGMRLEADASLVTALKTSIANITKAVEEAGLEIEEDGLVLGSYCTGISSLTQDMIELGSVIVDIGFDTTNIAVFKNGSLINSFSVGAGGYNITYDIAFCLGVPPMEAERIKISKGMAMMELVTEDEELNVNSISSVTQAVVFKSALAEVIESRLTDIFEKIKAEIEKLSERGIALGAILLTGGSVGIEGIGRLAENILGYPVKIGSPVNPADLPTPLCDPAYAMAYGLVLYGSTKRSRSIEKPPSSSKTGDFLNKIMEWLHEIF